MVLTQKKSSKHIHVSTGRKTYLVINYVMLSLLALLCIFPFINVIAISFSNSFFVNAGQVTFWPKGFTTASYKYLLNKVPFWNAFRVSVVRLLLGTAINMFLLLITAYPLSKEDRQLPHRKACIWFFFITMLIGGGVIPEYLLISELGLRNSIWALILPGALPVYNLVLMLNFFRQVPKEMEEAALIDGAGPWRTLLSIYIPMSAPAIATLTLFCMVGHWNSWFDGMIYMSDINKIPLQTYQRTILLDIDMSKISSSDYALLRFISDRSIKCTQIIVGTIPILCVYPFLQKYFVSGIALGAVKG